jgi:hypothetical protein
LPESWRSIFTAIDLQSIDLHDIDLQGTVKLLAPRCAKADRAKSGGQLIGHDSPEPESISPGVTGGGCAKAVRFGAKERGYLVMGG